MLIYNYFSSGGNIFSPIIQNQVLKSNSNYLATVSSTVQLPFLPVIGDTISLATNSVALLKVGLPNGYAIKNSITNEIIQGGGLTLASSQSVQLIYQEANLWSVIYSTSINSLVKHWGCTGGICSENYLGNYTSLTDCQSALLPPLFLGGQISGVEYDVTFRQTIVSSGWGSNHLYGQTYRDVTRTDLNVFIGKIVSVELGIFENRSTFRITDEQGRQSLPNDGGGSYNYYYGAYGGVYTIYDYTNIVFVRKDGTPDSTINPPSRCPI